MVVGHEGTDDDAEDATDEEGDGKGDLLDGGFVVDGVRGSHHDILVGNRESVIHVHCCNLCCCFLEVDEVVWIGKKRVETVVERWKIQLLLALELKS